MRLFLPTFFMLITTCIFMNAQCSTNDISEVQQSIPSYLKDLEEQGYCIIPQLISDSETKILYERVWHEFIEKAWPGLSKIVDF